MKGFSVTKIVKEIKFEGIWGDLEFKKGFQGQSVTKYMRLTLVFMLNSSLREKFNCYFFGTFLLVLTKFLFWQGDWTLGCHSISLDTFLIFPNFPRS